MDLNLELPSPSSYEVNWEVNYCPIDIKSILPHNSLTINLCPFLFSAMSSGGGGPEALRLLYEQKVLKLNEQKLLSDHMNHLLTRSGGLNENNKIIQKNLLAAIAVSKQPGYFDYYEPSTDIKEIEKNKILNNLVRNLNKIHRELEQINSEITQHQQQQQQQQQQHSLSSTRMNSIQKYEPVNVNNLSQWFETYGRPENVGCLEERKTTFQQSPKIYGGTNHHRAFKSQASTMKKGRVTK